MLLKKLNKISPAQWLRYALLGTVLIYVTAIALLHQQDQAKYPPVDALCPYGGLESLYSLLFTGRFLQRVFPSSVILLGITVVLLFVSGRSFCGWLCPFGTLQGIMHQLGRLFIRKPPQPRIEPGPACPLAAICGVAFFYPGRLGWRPVADPAIRSLGGLDASQ